MQKKNLFGIALLCASVFLFTGCKEIMSHFDNSVDSHLQVADKLTIIGVGDTYQITKDVDYKTISDADPSFESLDKAIATVEPKTGVVKALKSGDARIKISLPDNGLYLDASAVIDIKVRVQNAEQLVAEAKNASTTEKTTIFLDGSKTIELTANLDLYEKEVTIEGNGAIISTESSFLVSKSFILKDLKVDITGGTKQFIQIDPSKAGKKNQDVYKDAAVKEFFLIDEITLNNVWIKNLHNSLIDPMKLGPLALTTLNIENCIIQLDYNTTKSFIDFSRVQPDKDKTTGQIPADWPYLTDRGAIKNVNIKNNTIYNLQAASAYFIRFANQSNASGAFGTKNGTSTFDHQFLNNTIYNVFPNQNFGNNTVNNKVSAITMKDNIFGQVKNINKYVQNQQAPVMTLSNNFIFGDATQNNDYKDDMKSTVDNKEYTYQIATKLGDAPFEIPTAVLDLTKANGGLNLKPSGDAATAKAGDPRWYEAN